MSETTRRREDQHLDAPNRDGNVWSHQSCPVFIPRGGAPTKERWHCIYADIHQEKPRALEVGVCYYPKKL